LVNDTGTADGANDGGESGPGHDDTGSATSSGCGTPDSNTATGTGQGGGTVCATTSQVEDGEEAVELETATPGFLESTGQGTQTAHSEPLSTSLKPVLDTTGLVAGAELDNGAGHTLSGALEFTGGPVTVVHPGTLIDGAGWLEVGDLGTGMEGSGTRGSGSGEPGQLAGGVVSGR
jgi:hypothetical protein